MRERDHLYISQQERLHSVISCSPPVNWVCQCSATQLSGVLQDASPLLGEETWHKPYRNGIQKQRSVNEVLIAFIKTLTKELKRQKLLFPLKNHINNPKYINNHWGLHCFEGIIKRQDIRAWKDHLDVFFIGFCIRDETLYCFCFTPIPVLPSKNKVTPHFLLKLVTCNKNNEVILKIINKS